MKRAMLAVCLCACLIPLAGCPEEKAATDRAAQTVASARDNATALRAIVAGLPDTDPRKQNALRAADLLDQAANDLTLGVARARTDAGNDKSTGDVASQIGAAIPVPGVGTAVAGVVAGLLAFQSSRRGKALDAKTDEADALNSQASALIHSFEAAKADPGFKAALVAASPVINAVQATVPGTKALVDAAQLSLAVQ